MAKQQGAHSTTPNSADSIKDGECYADLAFSEQRPEVVHATDLLAYMSDMLKDLHGIADQHDWRMLSGLLGLAHEEAELRRKELGRRPGQ